MGDHIRGGIDLPIAAALPEVEDIDLTVILTMSMRSSMTKTSRCSISTKQ